MNLDRTSETKKTWLLGDNTILWLPRYSFGFGNEYKSKYVQKNLCKELVQIQPNSDSIRRMTSLRLTLMTNLLVIREKLDQFETMVEEAQQDPGRVA